MIMKGQKRKLQSEDVDDLDRERQRQSVFYISLNKYRRGQELPEPSLRRSVLIANTLRQVTLETGLSPSLHLDGPTPFEVSSLHQEREKEGILHRLASPNRPPVTTAHCHPPIGTSSPAGPPSQSAGINSASDRPPVNYLSNMPVFSPPMLEDSEDWASLSSEPDFSLSAAISSILTALDSSIDGSPSVPSHQACQRTPLRSLENLLVPGAPEEHQIGFKQGVKGHWGNWERQEEERASYSSVEVMRSSYLGDVAVDDLFQDIDTSLLDREMGSLGPRGVGLSAGDELLRSLPSSTSTFSPAPAFSSSSFLPSPPFSLSLSHSLKCLPSFASFSSYSPVTSSSPSSPYSGQSHMKDMHDLEHLMEILVGS